MSGLRGTLHHVLINMSRSARARLASVVEPLLKLISEYTGFTCVTLLAGSAPAEGESRFSMAAVHHGRTNETIPRNFYEWNTENFRNNVLTTFGTFIRAVHGE